MQRVNDRLPNALRALSAVIVLLLLLAEPGAAFEAEYPRGAIGDGIADDTSALQDALDRGGIVMLAPGKTYRITRRLDITRDNSGLVGDGTATLLMDPLPSAFDNADLQAKYRPNAVGILAAGVSGPRLTGLRIRYDNTDDERVVKAIAFRRCRDFHISGNDIAGFAKADGIVYVGACARGKIERNVIHDGYTNSDTRAQITGIVLDDDDQGSSEVEITDNRIYDLTVGPDFEAKFRVQTDGIHLTRRSRDILVANNDISNVGDGIDIFGTDVRVIDNRIGNAHQFGIKLIHGATRVEVARNAISNAGMGGIVIAGSGQPGRDTADNAILQNVISGINTGRRADDFTTFGIGVVRSRAQAVVRSRIAGNVVDAGAGARFGILVERGSGHDNVVSGNTVTGGRIATYRIDPDAGRQE